MLETKFGIDDKHKIVDIEDWEYVRSQIFNQTTPYIRKMLPIVGRHVITLLRENWCNEDEQELTDTEIFDMFPDEYALACQSAKDALEFFLNVPDYVGH